MKSIIKEELPIVLLSLFFSAILVFLIKLTTISWLVLIPLLIALILAIIIIIKKRR